MTGEQRGETIYGRRHSYIGEGPSAIFMGRHHIVDVEYHSLNGTQTAAAAISLPNRGHVASTGPDRSLLTAENTQERCSGSSKITM